MAKIETYPQYEIVLTTMTDKNIKFKCDGWRIGKKLHERVFVNADNGEKVIPELVIDKEKYLKISYGNLSTGKLRW